MSTYDFMETFEKSQQEAMQRNAAQAQKAAVAGLKPTSEGTPLTKAQEKLGRATYSWARPEYLATPFETYNAKNLPYAGAYGVGLANYGWNEENILDKIDFSRDMYQKDDKSGGYRQIYRGMREWGNKYNPKVTQLVETGEVPEGLDMDSVLHAADYGLRSLGQHQQNKKSFLNSPLGSIVKTGLTVASAFVPVVGPALAVGVGGGLGAMSGGGLKGGLMGAASGYTAGSLPATYGSGFTGMANMGRGIMSIPMNTARYLGNIGSSFGNLATGGLQGLQSNLGQFGRSIFAPTTMSNPMFTYGGGMGNIPASGIGPSPFTSLGKTPYAGTPYSTRLMQPRVVTPPLSSAITGGGLGGFAGDAGKQLAMNYAINALTPEPEPQYLDPYAGLYGSQGLMDLVTDDIYYDEDNPYENPEIDSYEDFQYYA
jgi:hypothetical protein